MLEEMMRYVNNRFDRDARGNLYGVLSGDISIEDGVLDAEIPEGRYFWVEGSLSNDGIHNSKSGLTDEEFTGRIILLSVPPAFISIASEIETWLEKNADALNGPYQSESFGGYSYTFSGGGSSNDESSPAAWQVRFGARLRPWRKLSRDWV